jgi:hypothetical protein
MKKLNTNKLALNKETLVCLDAAALDNVHGGILPGDQPMPPNTGDVVRQTVRYTRDAIQKTRETVSRFFGCRQ